MVYPADAFFHIELAIENTKLISETKKSYHLIVKVHAFRSPVCNAVVQRGHFL
jgi:hypothetical protein